MDVKVLREISAEGLERWEPVLKAAFPMSPDDVSTVLKALDIDRRRSSPGSRGRSTSSWPTSAAMARSCGRSTSTSGASATRINGCTSEVTDVTADGRPPRRSPSSRRMVAAVLQAVRQVGLNGFVNTSYPRGAAGHGRGAARSLRGDRRRHQLGEVPGRRAAAGRRLARRSSIGRRSPASARAWSRGARSFRSRWNARPSRSTTWSMRRGARVRGRLRPSGTAGLRIARNSADVLATHPPPDRRRYRRHIRRGREPAGLPRHAIGPWRGQREHRGVRHRGRQFAVHLRGGRSRGRALQRRCRRRPLHGAVRPGQGRIC